LAFFTGLYYLSALEAFSSSFVLWQLEETAGFARQQHFLHRFAGWNCQWTYQSIHLQYQIQSVSLENQLYSRINTTGLFS